MNIIILCDQIDCTFNQHDVKVWGVSGIPYNTCTHPKPAIKTTFGKTMSETVRICHSKATQANDPGDTDDKTKIRDIPTWSPCAQCEAEEGYCSSCKFYKSNER